MVDMHVVWKRIVKMKFCVKSLYMVITLLCVNDVFSMKDNSYDNIFQQNDSRVVVVTGNHLPKEVESLDTKELYIEKKGKPLSQLGTLPETLEVVIVNDEGKSIGGGTINTVTGQIRMNHWYDLQGRKLNSKPTTKGTYYHKGKLVIIK